MARQCTQPKRLRNSEWFKEKMLLTDDLDAFNSDCDEEPSIRVVLMANLSSYDSDVISDVLNIGNTSDSNIISYEQYMKENESSVVQDTTSLEQQNAR
ncbi:hypothetical protein Tco_0490872 [Tanacetum coccineum]